MTLSFGTRKTLNGVTFEWQASGFTLPEWYSHHSDKGPGPGWDSREQLDIPGFCEERYGFTPTLDQIWSNPSSLPALPHGRWVEVNGRQYASLDPSTR